MMHGPVHIKLHGKLLVFRLLLRTTKKIVTVSTIADCFVYWRYGMSFEVRTEYFCVSGHYLSTIDTYSFIHCYRRYMILAIGTALQQYIWVPTSQRKRPASNLEVLKTVAAGNCKKRYFLKPAWTNTYQISKPTQNSRRYLSDMQQFPHWR